MSASPSTTLLSEPRRTRLSSTDRRQQLLNHAIELFSKRGFAGTRTKDIAAACGVSEGILFHHFATKEDLYRAILQSHADEAGADQWMQDMQQFAAQRDDRALIHSLVTHIIRSFRDGAEFHRLLLYAWLEGHSLADMMQQQMGMPTCDFLKEYISTRQREGAFRDGDPGTMVVALFSPALQFGMSKYIFSAPWILSDDEPATDEFTRMLLAGLEKKKQSASKSRS
ncbi:MAG: TetR/AcrR family transcriptional regulator [Bryobacteraceae bacterium]